MNPINEYKFLAFTCIDQPIEEVKKKFCEILPSFARFPDNWILLKDKMDLENIYVGKPSFGGAPFMKFMLWEPINRPGKTVFFSNYSDGLNSYILNFVSKSNIPCIKIIISNEDKYTKYSFEYINEINKRTILAYKDWDKWKFYEEGETLDFENESYYKKHKIKDRLNKDIIISYLKALGWDVSDDNFWNSYSQAYYFERIKW